MNAIELPLDVLGVIISVLPLKAAVRLILVSKRLLNHEGWTYIEQIDFNLNELRATAAANATEKSKNEHALRLLECMANSLLCYTSFLKHIKCIAISSNTARELVHRDLPIVGPYKPVQLAFPKLLRLVLPQVEQVLLNCNIFDFIDPTEFCNLVDPEKIKIAHLCAPKGISSAFLTRTYPRLELLRVFLSSWSLPGVASQPNLKTLILLRSPGLGGSNPTVTLSGMLPTIEANPALSCINHEFFSLLDQSTSYRCKSIIKLLQQGPKGPRNIASIMRLANRPTWILFAVNGHNRNDRDSVFDLCYQGLFAGQQLRDICNCTFDIACSTTDDRPTAIWLDALMSRFFEEQKAAVASNLLLKGLLALCAILFSNYCQGRESFWHRKLLALPYYRGDCEAIQALRIDGTLQEWFEEHVRANPTSDFYRDYVRLLQSDIDRPINSYVSPEFELFLAEHPAFANPAWLFRTIISYMESGSPDRVLLFAKLAHSHGYRAKLASHTVSKEVSVWSSFLEKYPQNDQLVKALDYLFRIFVDSYDAITVELARRCFESSGSFESLAALLNAYSEAFGKLSPFSVNLMRDKIANEVWAYIFQVGSDSTLHQLMQSAKALPDPSGLIKEILAISDDQLSAHSATFEYSAARACSFRAAWNALGSSGH